MNLLLLLSALLSALTGVVGAVRAPQIAQSVAGVANGGRIAAARRVTAAVRPLQDVPAIGAVVVGLHSLTSFVLRAIEPHWASRRRE